MKDKKFVLPDFSIIQKVINNLQKNNMLAQFAECRKDAVDVVSKFINAGDVISVGGSVALEDAAYRVKTVTAPLIVTRRSLSAPCECLGF